MAGERGSTISDRSGTAFQRILLPTDYSALSRAAANYARLLAERFGGALHLVHVAPPGGGTAAPGMHPSGPEPQSTDAAASIESMERALDQFAAEALGNPGFPTHTAVVVGTTADQICQYAVQHEIDAIVIGTHADGIVHRIFLGSVSKAVVERAPCPVLMVPVDPSR